MWNVSGTSKFKGILPRKAGFKFLQVLTLTLLSLLVIIGGEAFAATYYVSPNGNNSSAGTSSAPWATFAKAMTVLQPGDTLYLMDGTYNQQLNISVSGSSSGGYITFRAVNPGSAIVSTSYPYSALVTSASYVEVDDINFRNSGPAASGNVYCSTNGYAYPQHVHGLNIGGDHIILRRVTANGSSGCNTSVISLAGASNSLLEDVAASGQGRVVLNLLNSNNITIRRGWFNWTGPDTGGGDTMNINQVYDSSNILMENCIGINSTSQAVGGIGTWAHYGNITDDTFLGNVVYTTTGPMIGALHDMAEYGLSLSNSWYENNVGIAVGSGYYSMRAAGSDHHTSLNNTYVGVKGSTLGFELVGRNANQKTDVWLKNSSFVNHSSGMYLSSSQPNTISIHTGNNYYNVDTPAANINLDPSEKQLNPSYDTATYGLGAYLMVPTALQAQGTNGADIGASVLYAYEDGTLTTTPLWPWPMESRVVAEFGASPTYANDGNGHTGGIWKTLNGVYGSTPEPEQEPEPLPPPSTGPDTTPPSVPAGQVTTVVSSSQINLAWTVSTDPVVSGQTTSGLAGYDVYRNGTKIASVTTASYSDTGLSPATAYSYTVAAFDAANNKSAQTQAITGTTDAVAITTASPVFAVNSGGAKYTSLEGVVYKADTGYSGWVKTATKAAIAGTSDDKLYKSGRYGNFSYRIPLPNGNYTVTLKFAETYWNAAGKRIFNVSMQGLQVISDLDIFAKVGKNAAYDVSVPVSVTNGKLNIKFTGVVDYAKVSGIIVTRN